MRIKIRNISKSYDGRPVLTCPRLDIAGDQAIWLRGPTGVGKSTFFRLLAGLELPDSSSPAEAGSPTTKDRPLLELDGTNILPLEEANRDAWRARHTAIIYQEFNLHPALTIEENLWLGKYFTDLHPEQDPDPRTVRTPSPRAGAENQARARELLEELGLWERRGEYTENLSRGERQRVAIGRAILRGAPLLLADEPTASLDPETAARISRLLFDYREKNGCLLLWISHDMASDSLPFDSVLDFEFLGLRQGARLVPRDHKDGEARHA